MSREVFLNYVWEKCIKPQIGYSFSIPHDVAYSIEAVQEANLASRFNPLFWQCACLSVNAGSSITQMEKDFGEEESDGDEATAKDITPDYGKITKAIVQARNSGAQIELPDINKAEGDFVPDVANNAIVFSLQSISGVNSELVANIMAHRPYSSLEDFIEKVAPSRQQMFALLKAGCFDSLYPGKARPFIVSLYLTKVANETIEERTKFTMANIPMLEKIGVLPQTCALALRALKYKKWEEANEYVGEERRFKIAHPAAVQFFEDYVKPEVATKKPEDCYPVGSGYAIKKAVFTKAIDALLAPLKTWLENADTPRLVREAEINAWVQETYNKYFSGPVSSWEMQTLHFYHGPHELERVNRAKYGIVNFDLLDETPKPIDYTRGADGTERPVYKIETICGTVVNSDNTKHLVTLLTNFNTVVDVKFFAGAYNAYNKATARGTEAKPEEKSWFEKGTHLLVSGFRRENCFVPRANYSAGIRSAIRLINGVSSNGDLHIITHKEGVKA